MTAPRITPGTRRDIGLVNTAVTRALGLVGGTDPPHLFTTLARQPKLFRGWLRFAGRLMPGGTLPRRETELAIIRVAQMTGCTYELDHHVHLGRRAGVTATDVERLTVGSEAEGWAPREQAILAAVEALHRHRDLDDRTWETLSTHLDEAETIELCLLVGHYEMLATVIATLRIQPDRRRRG